MPTLLVVDDEPSVCYTLARLFGDAALRQRMGRDARDSVLPRFGVDRYVASVVGVYDQLLKKVA